MLAAQPEIVLPIVLLVYRTVVPSKYVSRCFYLLPCILCLTPRGIFDQLITENFPINKEDRRAIDSPSPRNDASQGQVHDVPFFPLEHPAFS